MKRYARIALFAVPGLALALGAGSGCLGQAERTYYDDLIDGSADGTTIIHVDEASAPDVTTGMDALDEPPTGDDDAAEGSTIVPEDGGADADARVEPIPDAAPDVVVVV
jgi:hypothetical protein